VSSSNPPKHHRGLSVTDASDVALGGREPIANPNDQVSAAESLCALGRANGINCAIVAQPGKHDWPFASNAFAAALPWLAGRLDTPGVPRIPAPASWPPASAPVPHAEPIGR
jgi:S-formylglutathione hydrolase FrmB